MKGSRSPSNTRSTSPTTNLVRWSFDLAIRLHYVGADLAAEGKCPSWFRRAGRFSALRFLDFEGRRGRERSIFMASSRFFALATLNLTSQPRCWSEMCVMRTAVFDFWLTFFGRPCRPRGKVSTRKSSGANSDFDFVVHFRK